MAKLDKQFLIDTKTLLEISGLKKESTLRTYVGSYKVFVPVTTANSDKREYRFDQRCCEIKLELLKMFVPRSGTSMKEFCGHINEICGKRDENLLGRLNDGTSQRELTEEIEGKLLEILDT